MSGPQRLSSGFMGFLLGVLVMGLVAVAEVWQDRAEYRSDTGLMVLELRRQDGSVAEFYGHTEMPLADLRAPLTFPADPMVSACVDFAAGADRRAERQRESRHLAQ